MTKKKAFREPETSTAVAWEFRHIGSWSKWVLCSWAEPDKDRLTRKRPTDDAKMVRVRIIRSKDYHRLLKAAREKKS